VLLDLGFLRTVCYPEQKAAMTSNRRIIAKQR
jgi:hypothetical protein